VIGIGFLLLVSLVISTALAALVTYFSNLLPGLDFLWQIFNFILSFAITTFLFGLIFKVLPDVKIAWSDVLIGAMLTSFLFSIGRFLLGQYLGNGSFGSAYGAAGSLVVILAWVNYAAQILFFGAEFTQVYSKRYGSGIIPTKNAIPLSDNTKYNGKAATAKSSTNKKRYSSFANPLFQYFRKSKRLKQRRKNQRF
jgi:membrane protein